MSNAQELESARQTLEILKETVPDDEASGFDASGASGAHILIDGLEEEDNESRSGSGGSGQGWTSQTDSTSMTHEMTGLDLEGLEFSPNSACSPTEELTESVFTSQLDGLGDEEKEKALMGIFPILKLYDVKHALEKNKGNASLAIDQLMNESFLEENGIRYKGIDAFYESDMPPRQRKGKGKGKGSNRKGRMLEETDAPGSPMQSKWDTARQDVEFIASKIPMSFQQVGSIYHSSGGSVKATITAIIAAHQAMNIEEDDPIIKINTFQLRQDFPAIPTPDLEGLVQLTNPSLSNARELAKALSSHAQGSKTPIQLEFRRTPLNLSEPSTPSPTTLKSGRALDPISANNIAANYTNARNTAFTQASSYYRKGKSDHLMGGATAYYSSLGRDYNTLAKAAQSQAADSLVATQSSKFECDLHGVNVKDAVRISREKVTAWWAEGGRGGGYRIVTGAGHHSVGGRAKLGPAVGKMLVREGWKVEVGGAFLVVRGVVKRK